MSRFARTARRARPRLRNKTAHSEKGTHRQTEMDRSAQTTRAEPTDTRKQKQTSQAHARDLAREQKRSRDNAWGNLCANNALGDNFRGNAWDNLYANNAPGDNARGNLGDKSASGEVKKPPERSKKWMSKNVPKWPSRSSQKGSKNEPLKGPYFRHVFEKEADFQNLRWTRNGKRVSTSAISRARGRDFSELSLTRTQPQTSTERRGQTTATTLEAKEPYSRRFAALLLPNPLFTALAPCSVF